MGGSNYWSRVGNGQQQLLGGEEEGRGVGGMEGTARSATSYGIAVKVRHSHIYVSSTCENAKASQSNGQIPLIITFTGVVAIFISSTVS